MKRSDTEPSVQRQIDENLRRAYGDLLDSKVPDKFTALLEQLRQQEESSRKPT